MSVFSELTGGGGVVNNNKTIMNLPAVGDRIVMYKTGFFRTDPISSCPGGKTTFVDYFRYLSNKIYRIKQ